MSAPADLTRWNRAGLTRLRYIDGNAATYLEELRSRLADAFGQWAALKGGAPPDESDSERIDRLLEQYEDDRRDLAWETARSFARAAHVLAEHLDAYANEGYLGTTSQWNNVRRLVEMLDYHAAPPASAYTTLVLESKTEATDAVEKGFQVKYSPPDGGAAVIFETLADIDVNDALNESRLKGWDKSVSTFREDHSPAGAVGTRPAISLQGIGPNHAARLNAFIQTKTGRPAATATIADVAALDQDPGVSGISSVRLAEFRTKARVVLGWAVDLEGFRALVEKTLSPILAAPNGEIISLTSQTQEDVEDLKQGLRMLQIALDESAFQSITLAELAGVGAQSGSPWIASEDMEVSAGQVALVVREDPVPGAAVVYIDEVNADTGVLELRDAPSQEEWRDWAKGVTTLLVRPKSIRAPSLNGPDVVRFEESHGLSAGDVVAWEQSAAWTFDKVAEADEKSLRLESAVVPDIGSEVHQAYSVLRGSEGLLFPSSYLEAVLAPAFTPLEDGDWEEIAAGGSEHPTGTYRRIKNADIQEIFIVPDDSEPVGTTVSPTPGAYEFAGSPGDLASGQWVVGDDGSSLRALKIRRISELEDSFRAVFDLGDDVGPVGNRPVRHIQGVGQEYAIALQGSGVETIGELRELRVAEAVLAISAVRLAEFKTKADIVLSLDILPSDYEAILADKVTDILETSVTALAASTGRSEDEMEALHENLRLIQIALDETALEDLTLRDLLPDGDSAAAGALEKLVRLYGPFEHTIHPLDYDYNATAVEGVRLDLDTETSGFPDALIRGKEILVEQETGEGFENAAKVTIAVVLADEGAIEISEPLAVEDGFTVGNTVIRGNVVEAGHGEIRPRQVLGSGDATQSSQSFFLEVEDVSFVADATQSTGVRADLDVKVEERTWEQVSTLNDSAPSDHHYTVRMTEDGYLKIEFGDGARARRLPEGPNNVRVTYRVGAGLEGNVSAGSLAKPVKPHRLVESVRQPLDAAGGNGMEGVESLRGNAPASLLTLERAVSETDFAHLAASQSSVWQATAAASQGKSRGRTSVEVAVVPAGGAELGDLAAALQDFLQQHSLPGVDVTVVDYESQPFGLAVTVRVNSAAFEPDEVIEAVRDALKNAFSIENRKLGQDLYVSEVYQVVESVTGVENSVCVIDGDPSLRRREASDRGVIYLHEEDSVLSLEVEEFEL